MPESSNTMRCLLVAGLGSILGIVWGAGPSLAEARSQPIVLDGSADYGGLTQGPDGTIYGATQSGGRTPCAGQWTTRAAQYLGCGTIFRIRPNGRAETFYYFQGGRDGVGPQGLAVTPDGSLIGMSSVLGNTHPPFLAKVFRLTQAGALTSLSEVESPADHGDLAWDGSEYFGIALDDKYPFYVLSLSGKVKRLAIPAAIKARCGNPMSLGDGDNDISYGPTVGPAGAAYATTEKCVLRLAARSDDFKVVANTTRFAFVNAPQFDDDGNIYVAAWLRGTDDHSDLKREQEGVIRIGRSGDQTTLAVLSPPDQYSDANYITGFVMGRDHNLYGVAYDGGRFGDGMLFAVDRAGNLRDLHDFCEQHRGTPIPPACDDGWSAPFANLLAAQDGTIWGASDHGVFKYQPAIHDFAYVILFNDR